MSRTNAMDPRVQPLTGTILLAEDEEDVRFVVEHMLQKLGFRVITANNGQAAVEQFAANSKEIDLVILDHSMPYLDGSEVFNMIKKMKPQIKALLTTGHTIPEEVASLMANGLTGMLSKPFNLSDMKHAVRRALNDN